MNKTYKIKLPKNSEPLCSAVHIENGEAVLTIAFKEPFNPKDGDFLAAVGGRVFIYNGSNTDIQYGAYCGIDIYNEIVVLNYFSSAWTGKEGCRFATPEEKDTFLERLEKECHKKWNEKTKQLEDIRWRAKKREGYYTINGFLDVVSEFAYACPHEDVLYERGNYFRTPEAAQKVADQIKEIFKNSKAE